MTAPATAAPGALATELQRLAEPRAERWLISGLLALSVHAGAGVIAARMPQQLRVAPPPVDVELALREPPQPEPAPEPVAAPPQPAAPERLAAPRPAPRPAAAPPAPPPPAAKAGAVLTAPDPAPAAAAEPFDFTSDPSSHVYGSGVVAVGGTATHGLTGAGLGGTAARPAPIGGTGDGLTPASDLSQKPRLRSADPCRGYFPDAARDDVAVVSIRVVIGKQGAVSSASIISESPSGQGFGAAARRCMLEQTFEPALDRSGGAASTALNVNVRFSR